MKISCPIPIHLPIKAIKIVAPMARAYTKIRKMVNATAKSSASPMNLICLSMLFCVEGVAVSGEPFNHLHTRLNRSIGYNPMQITHH